MELLHDIDRVVKKHRSARATRVSQIDSLISALQDAKNQIEACRSNADTTSPDTMELDATTHPEEIIASLSPKVQQIEKEIGMETKELQVALSKSVKNVDKTLPADWSKAVLPIPLEGALIDEIIVEHFMRDGRIELAKLLMKETDKQLDSRFLEPFEKITAVCKGLSCRNLEPALAWTFENSSSLAVIDAEFPFEVAKAKFNQLASQSAFEAIEFSRLNFPQFASTKLPEIQKLMGSLAFRKRTDKSLPDGQADTIIWERLEDLFLRDNCRLLGLSDEMPLSVCIRAGALALPKLLKLAAVMGKSGDWSLRTPPPVDVQAGGATYHSVFVCPVSREAASPENPPMMMQCGHVLCEQSLRKLARGTVRVKCPYCPSEVTVQGSLRLFI